MLITCWGSRGSVPVCGEKYIKYGGDTTCVSIIAKSGDIVIIDAGTGIRKLGVHPDFIKINEFNLLFTHFHWDHVMGFNFFSPILNSSKTIIIQNSRFSSFFAKDVLDDLMRKPFFPLTMGDLKAKIKFENAHRTDFSIGSLNIESIPLSHPGEGAGYKFIEDEKTFVFLTDNELDFDHPGSLGKGNARFNAFVKFSKNADLLFHDGEFTPEEYPFKTGWGHSAYTSALDLAMKANVKRLGLFHINQERQDKDMDMIIERCKDIIKMNNSGLKCFGVSCNMTFDL